MIYIDDIVKKTEFKIKDNHIQDLFTKDDGVDYKDKDYVRHLNNLNGGYRGRVCIQL